MNGHLGFRWLASPFLRFALLMPLVMGCIVAAVFWPLYQEAEEHIRNEVHAAIEQEILALDGHLHDKGLDGLTAELSARAASPMDPDAIYALAAPDGHLLAGNLAAWPGGLPSQDDAWFRIRDEGGHYLEGKLFLLFGGERLLVGRRSPLAGFRQAMGERLWWSGALLLLATGLLVGLFMGRLHRRLGTLATEADAIRQGHLSRRLTVGPRGDELDQLAVRFNEAFDEIEHQVEATRHISSALAHDLRRPLIALSNAIDETLASDAARASPLAPRLEALGGQTERLLHAFSALLRLARLEAGNWSIQHDPCNLARIAEDAGELYEALAERQGYPLTLALTPLEVPGDRDLLFQLCQNLLENACLHGAGPIRLSLAQAGQEALLEVADQGPGVPEAALPRLFDRFYRADPSRSGDTGSGIGLALVKGIAQAHGGRVRADNTHPGLRIRVWLPLWNGYHAASHPQGPTP
ncbi:MAG: HAMP domain-containing sensor histidine kinase [Rhodocyclaceae bacterium]|jgi:signal transduction histidine kinase|nr:HAMP domain-containing sensor histidine kinase [Rhodocyclaceae bacterium]